MEIDSNRVILSLPVDSIRVFSGESGNRTWAIMSINMLSEGKRLSASLDISKSSNRKALESVANNAKYVVIRDGYLCTRQNKKTGDVIYQINARMNSTDFVKHDLASVNLAIVTGTVIGYKDNFAMLSVSYMGGFGDNKSVKHRNAIVRVGGAIDTGVRIFAMGHVEQQHNNVDHLHIVSKALYYK